MSIELCIQAEPFCLSLNAIVIFFFFLIDCLCSPHMYQSLENPQQQYTHVIGYVSLVLLCLYVVVMLFGYYLFAEETVMPGEDYFCSICVFIVDDGLIM